MTGKSCSGTGSIKMQMNCTERRPDTEKKEIMLVDTLCLIKANREQKRTERVRVGQHLSLKYQQLRFELCKRMEGYIR